MRGTPSYFGRQPRVLHAIGDCTDTQVQASSSAQLGGVPVLGLTRVSTSGNAARAVVLFDAQRAFSGVNAGWGQYLRGVATLEEPSRSRSEADQSFAERLVTNDPQQVRIVPASELVP